jgi:hypothetical protein
MGQPDLIGTGVAGLPCEKADRREAVQLYTKAVLKRLGWTAVVTVVAVSAFLIAMAAGLPQMPTVGFICLGIVAAAVVLARVYRPGDNSVESGNSADRQQRG